MVHGQIKTYQEDLLEPFENLPHHLPHLGYQLEDPERTQAAQHHQQLSPRLRRDVSRQPAQKDQAHLQDNSSGTVTNSKGGNGEMTTVCRVATCLHNGAIICFSRNAPALIPPSVWFSRKYMKTMLTR